MSKSIKVSEDVKARLKRLMGAQESYSEVIDRCMSTLETLKSLPLFYEREAVKRSPANMGVDPMREAILEKADLAHRTL